MPHMKVKVAEEQEEVIRAEKGPVVPESAPTSNVPVGEVFQHIAHPVCNEVEGCVHVQAEEVAIDEILDNSDPLHGRDAVGVDKEDHQACPLVGIALSPRHRDAILKCNGKDPNREETDEEDISWRHEACHSIKDELLGHAANRIEQKVTHETSLCVREVEYVHQYLAEVIKVVPLLLAVDRAHELLVSGSPPYHENRKRDKL